MFGTGYIPDTVTSAHGGGHHRGLPFLVHQELSVEVLVVAGCLHRVYEFFGLDELVTIPVYVVWLGHSAAYSGQPLAQLSPIQARIFNSPAGVGSLHFPCL